MKLILRPILMTLFAITLMSLNAFSQTATISTDQADYPPGSTVIITGTGWQPGETVTLQVVHQDPALDNSDPVHQPWTVTADASGNVSSSWNVPYDLDELGATLILSAIGGSSSLQAETVFTDAVPTITAISPTSGSTNGGYSITITASGGNPFGSGGAPYTLTIGGISGTITNVNAGLSQITFTAPAHAAGAVDIIVFDKNGHLAAQSPLQFTYTCATLIVTATITQANCHGGPASVTVTATGGTAPYSGTGTFSLADGTSRTYTVQDANGCSGTSNSVTATSPSQVVATAVITQALCHGGAASVTVTATGGIAPYSGTGTFSLTDGASSTYTVLDHNNCSATSNSVTATSPSQVFATAVITQALCHGDPASVLVTATGGTGAYTGTGTFPLADGVTTSYTVHDANNCSATSNSVTATSPSQVIATAVITQALCHGGPASVLVTATGGTGAYTGTGTFPLADGVTTSYTVHDANNCSATSNSVTATSPSQVVATAVITQALCHGDPASVLVTATGGTGSYTGTGTFPLADGVTTSYTVHDANNCSATSNSVTATSPSQVVATAVITQALCHGDPASVLVTATGGTGSYTGTGTFPLADGATASYPVHDANNCSAISNSVTATSPSQVVATAVITQAQCHGDPASVVVTATGGTGAYTGTGTFPLADGATASYPVHDANNCSAISNSVTATSPSQIVATAVITQALCHGDPASVVVTATGGTGTYTGTGTFPLADGATTSYTVHDANNCSAISNSVTATSPSQIVATAVITQALCNGNPASVTVTATGGTGSYTGTGTFSLADGNSSTYTVQDGNGCSATSNSVTAGSPSAVTGTCSNNNSALYFGYAGDQTSTITGKVTGGGVGPYKIEIKMSRPLMCDVVNSSGDEVWTPSGGSTTGNSCGSTPVSTLSGVSLNGTYSVNVTLLDDADFYVTIIDANGCRSETCTTHVHGEDVRCFAGNSGITKVQLCHKTGSAKTPCVTICVDADAVQDHLAHGDFYGKCTPNCIPTYTGNAVPGASTMESTIDSVTTESVFGAKVYPNPTSSYFNLKITSASNERVKVTVVDAVGRVIEQRSEQPNSTVQIGQNYQSGIFFVEVLQGNDRVVLRIAKVY